MTHTPYKDSLAVLAALSAAAVFAVGTCIVPNNIFTHKTETANSAYYLAEDRIIKHFTNINRLINKKKIHLK